MFDSLVRARDVLLDTVLRKIYDDAGEQRLEEHTSGQERAKLSETSFDDGSDNDIEWRQVEEGEVFGAGEYFWMDQSTGITYVAVHASSSSNEPDMKDDACQKDLETKYSKVILCKNILFSNNE